MSITMTAEVLGVICSAQVTLARVSEFKGKTCVLLERPELLGLAKEVMRSYMQSLQSELREMTACRESLASRATGISVECLANLIAKIDKTMEEAKRQLTAGIFLFDFDSSLVQIEKDISDCFEDFRRWNDKANPFGVKDTHKGVVAKAPLLRTALLEKYETIRDLDIKISTDQSHLIERVRAAWSRLESALEDSGLIEKNSLARLPSFNPNIRAVLLLEKVAKMEAEEKTSSEIMAKIGAEVAFFVGPLKKAIDESVLVGSNDSEYVEAYKRIIGTAIYELRNVFLEKSAPVT